MTYRFNSGSTAVEPVTHPPDPFSVFWFTHWSDFQLILQMLMKNKETIHVIYNCNIKITVVTLSFFGYILRLLHYGHIRLAILCDQLTIYNHASLLFIF